MILDLGKIRANFKGTFALNTAYSYNDVVKYGGNLYVFIAETPFTPTQSLQNPTVDDVHWDFMLGGLRNRGPWAIGTQYLIAEWVKYGPRVYQAQDNNIGQAPSPSSSHWTLVVDAISYNGAWVTATQYYPNQLVSYNGVIYICLLPVNNSTSPAADGGTNWAVWIPNNGYSASSVSSLAIATGSKAFTVGTGLAYAVGNRARASSQANSANYMEGPVTSYTGGVLTLNVTVVGGSGTFADWVITERGEPAPSRITGTATLVAGTVTITDSRALTASRIFVSRHTTGGTVGELSTTISNGVSFTINSSSSSETSTVDWELIP